MPPRASSAAPPDTSRSTPTRAYELYGISVASDIPLTSAPRSGGRPDISIVSVPELSSSPEESAFVAVDDGGRFSYHEASDGRLILRWRGLFEFLVASDGRSIEAHELRHGPPDRFETHLLSQVLSTALLRFGREPFHATVVDTLHGAVGFLGDSGFGKSCLAATFIAAGDRLVTDDLLLVDVDDDDARALPGPRRLKLYPSDAAAILGAPSGATLNPDTRKAVIPLTIDQVAARPARLAALYMLAEPARYSDELSIRFVPATKQQAFLGLTEGSFNSIVVGPERLASQFRSAVDLARAVPVHSLAYPKGRAALPEVRDAVLRHAFG